MAPAPQSQTRKGKSAPSRAKSTSGRRSAQDAVALLKADHRAVEKLFGQLAKTAGGQQKGKIANQICSELKVHMRIEEEILYPMSRDFLDNEEIVDEAFIEHASAKEVITQIEGLRASQDGFDAKLAVLQDLIEAHVKEEETEFFPRLQKSDMDLSRVGERLARRKQELTRSAAH